MSEELIDWSLSLRAKGRAESTIRDYLSSAERFVEWLGAEPSTAKARDIRKYLGAMETAPATRAKHYRNLQQLYKFLWREELIDSNPFDRLEAPHVPEQPVPVLPDEAVSRILAACSGSSFLDRRDHAIIRLLADSGVRASELIGMKVHEVDYDTLTVPVLGKGRRMRLAVFGHKTAQALRRYVRARNQLGCMHQASMWVNKKGEPLTDSGLRQMIERRGLDAGVQGVHPHLFRHYFAHKAKMNGMQDGDLKRLGGWKSDQMLHRYGASAADERALAAHRRAAIGDSL